MVVNVLQSKARRRTAYKQIKSKGKKFLMLQIEVQAKYKYSTA